MEKIIGLRVGDHSYLNNKIDYTKTYEEQKDVINYLDSSENPVGLSKTSNYLKGTEKEGITGNGGNYNTITDYAISNYWTFITAESEIASNEESITIKESKDSLFNLSARVFYDEKNASGATNGIFDKQVDKDHLLSDITLNLYKKTNDEVLNSQKVYVILTGTEGNKKIEKITELNGNKDNIYELIKTGITPLQGTYMFSGIEYDKEKRY